jgi:hypothetical protein
MSEAAKPQAAEVSMFSQLKARWQNFRYRHILLEAIVSVCLGYLIWLYTHSRAGDSTDFVHVPVQLQLVPAQRDQFAIESQGPTRVNVMFSGPYARIRELRRKIQRGSVQAMVTVTVPEDKQLENSYTDVTRLSIADLSVPPGVTVELADENATIPFTIHRLAERILPVRLDVTGEVRVSHVKIEPTTVAVRGPKAILDRVSFIPTQPCSLQPDAETSTSGEPVAREQVALVTELEGRAIQVSPHNVNLRCKVAPKQKLYELTDIPVHFLCPVNFPLTPRFLDDRPGKVSLRLMGPATDAMPPVLAFVDLTSGTYARGRNLEPVRLQLPKDFQLVQNTSPLVAFTLEEPDSAVRSQESGVKSQESRLRLAPPGSAVRAPVTVGP